MDNEMMNTLVSNLNGILLSGNSNTRYSYIYKSGIHSLVKLVDGIYTKTVKRTKDINEMEDYILMLTDVFETVYNTITVN